MVDAIVELFIVFGDFLLGRKRKGKQQGGAEKKVIIRNYVPILIWLIACIIAISLLVEFF